MFFGVSVFKTESSIERLAVEDPTAKFEVIFELELDSTPYNISVAPLNEKEIMIMGGYGNPYIIKPMGIVYLFNVELKYLKRDLSSDDFNFVNVSNTCVNFCDNQVVALVTEKGNSSVVHYKSRNKTLKLFPL